MLLGLINGAAEREVNSGLNMLIKTHLVLACGKLELQKEWLHL